MNSAVFAAATNDMNRDDDDFDRKEEAINIAATEYANHIFWMNRNDDYDFDLEGYDTDDMDLDMDQLDDFDFGQHQDWHIDGPIEDGEYDMDRILAEETRYE